MALGVLGGPHPVQVPSICAQPTVQYTALEVALETE